MNKLNLQKYTVIALLISLAISMLIHLPAFFDRLSYEETENLTADGVLNLCVELVITTLVSFLMFLMNYVIIKPFNKQKLTKRIDIGIATVMTFLFVFVLNHFLFAFKKVILAPDGEGQFRTNFTFQNLVVATAVVICVVIIRLVIRKQTIELENERLKTESLQSQFDSLKNQVSPHFLFNSLNALQTLIRDNNELAQKYVRHLSQVLRYTLQSTENKTVILSDELSFLESYLFLIQLRFGTNFKIELKIDEQYLNFRIPPLALQTLIENAVKHNEISKRRPLTIQVITNSDQSIQVSNPIQKKIMTEPGTGIGLANLEKQYQLIANQMIIIKKVNGEFIVVIPLLNPKKV